MREASTNSKKGSLQPEKQKEKLEKKPFVLIVVAPPLYHKKILFNLLGASAPPLEED